MDVVKHAEPVGEELTAHHIPGAPRMELVPASRERDWMELAQGAKRCLPIPMANQAGWWMLNPARFEVVWTGETHELGVSDPATGRPPRLPYLRTNFGHGILTVLVPYLFRTSPGWDLLARGAANYPRHGIQALEGLVETDWACATFTMNWQFTAPDVPVTFEAGEPLCQIVPMRRGALEEFEPKVEQLRGDLLQCYSEWIRVRNTHHQPAVTIRDVDAVVKEQRERQGEYARGRLPGGKKFEDHRTRLRLREFVGMRGA